MEERSSSELARTARELSRRAFDVRVASDRERSRDLVLASIPPTATVGIGDSATLRQIGLLDSLEQRGQKMLNPVSVQLADKPAERLKLMRAIFSSDIFLSGCNAITLDGKVMSIDMVGNRACAMAFGAPQVILVVGRNKIVADIEAARERIRQVIAPVHARGKGRKTPCNNTGKCSDCNSPERICNVITILEHKPLRTAVTVVLVDDDLGLSWDVHWPAERIARIRTAYEGVTHSTRFVGRI